MRGQARIRALEGIVRLKAVGGHMKIEIVSRGRRVIQLTNVTANLTSFEKMALMVHAYKLMESSASNSDLKKRLGSCNYAEVFGSPWPLGA